MYIIWSALPNFDDPDSNFCNHESLLDISILSIFYANLKPTVDEILLEFDVIKNLHYIFYSKMKLLVTLCQVSYLNLVLFLIVLAELIVWFGVVVVGTKLILTSESPTDIVLASVAITFINDIDNYFYNAFISKVYKNNIEEVFYSVPNLENNKLEFHLQEDRAVYLLFSKIKLCMGKENITENNVRVKRTLPTRGKVARCDKLFTELSKKIMHNLGGSYLVLVPICVVVFELKKSYCDRSN